MVLMVFLYVLKRCRGGVGTPPCLRGSPLFSLACRALSRLLVAAVCRVWWFVVSSFSVSDLSCVVWSEPCVVSRLGWCASSRSVLVWVKGSSSPRACRVGRLSPVLVSRLVASLRSARASGAVVSLGVRSGWSPARWFCAVAPVSAAAERAFFAG